MQVKTLLKLNTRKTTFYKTQRKFNTFFHNYHSNSKELTKGTNISLYTAPEWEEIHSYLQRKHYYDLVPSSKSSVTTLHSIWTECVFNTSFKSKYFGLLLFFAEDKFSKESKKKFVLNMSVYSETKTFSITCAMASGIHTFIEPVEDVVPITPGDYRMRQRVTRARPADFIDIDMVYANRKTLNMLCFDKQGTWHKEGVDHECLQVSETYKENNWFDHLQWNNRWF